MNFTYTAVSSKGGWKCTFIFYLNGSPLLFQFQHLKKPFKLLPGLFSVGHWRPKKRHLINASTLTAHNGKKRLIVSANLYLR